MATANTQPVTTPARKCTTHTARDGRRFLIEEGFWITHGWESFFGESQRWIPGEYALDYVIATIDKIIAEAEGDEDYIAEHWGDDHKVIDGMVLIDEDLFCDLAQGFVDDVWHGWHSW